MASSSGSQEPANCSRTLHIELGMCGHGATNSEGAADQRAIGKKSTAARAQGAAARL